MIKKAGRILIAGTGSGCGKTTVVCAILQALKSRGLDIASFKCGPDYIDPMFHSEIISTPCTNIDLYFTREALSKGLLLKHAAEFNVIEGVMGYYDGLSMQSAEASSWHMAQALSAPTILVVNGRGMALSAAAVVKGFQAMRTPNCIAGVIINRVSPMSYPQLKAVIEQECGVHVYGYMPSNEAFAGITLGYRKNGLALNGTQGRFALLDEFFQCGDVIRCGSAASADEGSAVFDTAAHDFCEHMKIHGANPAHGSAGIGLADQRNGKDSF